MADALQHRGPDSKGVWCDPDAGIGMAHSRLSILDLSPAGHQPMVSKSGRYVIVFNGEIYNHLDIRELLCAGSGDGKEWAGHSDTETILTAFDAWGIEATLKRCIGMFALSLWDKEARVLTLARDRLGEKPLYYGWQGNTFLFGSELKALKGHPAFIGDIDRDALVAYMRYCYVPAPRSIYRGIYKLKPGTTIQVRGNVRTEAKPVSYWSLLDVSQKGQEEIFEGTETDALSKLENRLAQAVSSQQISDVPLGAFLSGGIDSSVIVALMQAQTNTPVRTFTIGFSEQQYNEAVYAKAVAKHLGTDHTEWIVTPNEARDVIPQLPELYDEPFADSSQIPTFLVSQLARRNVTVSLSGDGGDELFGGYNRYVWARRVQAAPAWMRKILGRSVAAIGPAQWDGIFSMFRPVLPQSLKFNLPGDKVHKLASVLSVNSGHEVYRRLVSAWQNPDELVKGGGEKVGFGGLWDVIPENESIEHRMMAIDSLTYLPDDILCKVDRAAMGVSLETRVPFLDHRVVEFAWQLPQHMKIRNKNGKWILRQVLYKYVPKELIERPKMGFGVPIDSWLRGPLREWAEDLLSESRLRREGYFHHAPIRKKWAEHLSGRRNWQYQLWCVLMFQAWLAEHSAPLKVGA